MTLFVDASVWSLALRRDGPARAPEVEALKCAAELRNRCRRAGIQVGTIDAILAQLCIRHQLTLLSTDKDFIGIAKHVPLRVWSAPS